MQKLESYRNTHTELRQMIDELRALLTMEQMRLRPNVRIAHELLCDLGDRVRKHLAEEDRGLYPSLLIHEDPRIKSIAWGFISGGSPLRKLFDDYHNNWLNNSDFNFCEEFIAETHHIFEMIGMRLDREEQVLFPQLSEIKWSQEARV